MSLIAGIVKAAIASYLLIRVPFMIVFNRRRTSRYRPGTLSVGLLLGALCSAPALAESQQEILLFPSIDTFDPFDESDPTAVDSFQRASLNVVYSFSGDKFRFLGEYLWSSSEAELERLKAGWQFQDNTLLWLGRYHATAKYWTSEYHHGQFLQTSITRPSLEEWEDESGPTPSHVTGFSLEHDYQREDESAWSFAFSAGLTAKFEGEELAPFDFFEPHSGHGPGVNFKVTYRPEFLSSLQAGFLSAWHEIRVVSESSPSLADLNEIKQLTVGGFVDWRWKDFRLISSVVHFENELDYVDGLVSDTFLLTYVQFEYGINDDFTFFGRTDNGFDEDQSPYLRLLPGFIAHRHMLGLRWDVASFHSLTVEVADTSQQGDNSEHDHFKEIRFQWSAVFP